MKSNISGFPELTPNEQLIKDQVLQQLSNKFELFGFQQIETSSVEKIDSLLKKGETSKEIYTLSRLQDGENQEKAKLGLHFDLTVPFSRYVAENLNDLNFPFFRYQIQNVWRGERPQAGRFREFLQADIDVVSHETLPFYLIENVIESFASGLNVLSSFGINEPEVLLNHRRIWEEIFDALTISKTHRVDILTLLDKYHKVDSEYFVDSLKKFKLDQEKIEKIINILQISTSSKDDFILSLSKYIEISDNLTSLVLDLGKLINKIQTHAKAKVKIDLSVVRGLDYYTGVVIETFIPQDPDFGSIASGGQYDNLIQSGKQKYPGFGISFGITRILYYIFSHNLVDISKKSNIVALVAVNDEKSRLVSEKLANLLRSKNINTIVSPSSDKYGAQIKYAEKLSIPYVWFIDNSEKNLVYSVKNIISGEQETIKPEEWKPLI